MLTNTCSEISGKSCDLRYNKFVVVAWSTTMWHNSTAARCSASIAGVVMAVASHYNRFSDSMRCKSSHN